MMPSPLPTSLEAQRIATLFHRKLTTAWTKKEIKAFQVLQPFDPEELVMVERYYRMQWPPRTGINILRHDLQTLLNNWPSECDRARVWCQRHPLPSQRKLKPAPLPEPEPAPLDPETLAAKARFQAEFERVKGKKMYKGAA